MFCKYCGKEVKEGAKFCTNCGEQTEKEKKENFRLRGCLWRLGASAYQKHKENQNNKGENDVL